MANSGFPDTNVIDDVAGAMVDMALGEVQSRVDTLKKRSEEAQALQRIIGQTMRLRTESNKASATHALNAREVRTQLDANLGTLREQGIAVDKLEQHYRLLGNTARKSAQQGLGLQQIQTGWKALQASSSQVSGAIGMARVPVKASADYQALIRGIAIQAGVANTPEEDQLGRQVITISRDTGMARNDVAGVLNQLVAAGMDLKQALQYTPVASTFVVGQEAGAGDTAKIISALRDQAGITEPQDIQKALESIAYQTQAGHFETGDMAKWLAELLPLLSQQGTTGLAAVNQIGAMLQVQTRSTGNADAAGAELKTWVSGIGSADTVSAYKAVGIDYRAELATRQQQGLSPLESSVALARQYVEKSSPEKARQMAEGTARISQEADPEKARQMLKTLEQVLLTGNAFADVQVKVALAGAAQNEQLYQQHKNGGANAGGLLDQNLGERRETSSQKWKEAGDATDDAMRSIGDSLRPVTDVVADTVRQVAISVGALAEQSPRVVQGLAGVAVAALAVFKGIAAYRLGQGLVNFAKGTLGGNNKEQPAPEAGPPSKDHEKPARRGRGHDHETPASRQPAQRPADTPRSQTVSPAGRFITRFSGLGFSGNGAGLQAGSAPRPARTATQGAGWREAGGKLLAAAGTVFLAERLASRTTGSEAGNTADAVPDQGVAAVNAITVAPLANEKEVATQVVDTNEISVKPVAAPVAVANPDEGSAQGSGSLVVVEVLEGALKSLHGLRDTSAPAEKSGVDLFDVGLKSLAVTREVLEKNTAQGSDSPLSLGTVALDVLEGGLKVAGSVRGEPKDGELDTFNPIDIGQKGIAAAREVMEKRAQAGSGGKGSLALDLVEGGLRFAGKLRGEPKEGEEGGFDLVGTSLKVVDSLRESISSTSTNSQADAATSDDSPVDNGSADAAQGQSAADNAASQTSGATAAGVQRVFVVNLDGLKGGGASSSASSSSSPEASDSPQGTDTQGRGTQRVRGRRRGARNRRRAGANRASSAARTPAAPPAPAPALPEPDSVRAGRLSRVTDMLGKATGFIKKTVPLARVVEAGSEVAQVLTSDKTAEEKAEGIGSVGGGLAGGLAGAAAGAAIGSVVPIIGTALGGVIGGIIGADGGEWLGGTLGRWLLSDDNEPPSPRPLAPVSLAQGTVVPFGVQAGSAQAGERPMTSIEALSRDVSLSRQSAALEQARQLNASFQAPAAGAAPGGALPVGATQAGAVQTPPAPVNQQISMPITVQGDVKDPQALIQSLQPYILQVLAQFNHYTGDRQLFDAPHL